MKAVLLKFLSTVNRYRMIEEEDRIVAAVSGGPDSVSLLHFLVRFRRKLRIENIIVAHVNYAKRGQDSDLDQEFVEKLSMYLGLDVYVKKVSPAFLKRVKSENFQKVARDVRYRFFRELAEKTGSNKIAVAHTLDDQAETVFMRFLGGQGIKGLKGIPPVSDNFIIRPFIEISKEEILAFLQSESLGYRLDRSNLEDSYERNRIRNEVFPFLEKMTERDVIRKIYDAGEIFRQIDDLIDNITQRALSESFSRKNKSLNVKKYGSYPELVRKSLLQRIGYRDLGRELNNRVIEKIDSLLLREIPSFAMNLPGNYILERSYDVALFREKKTEKDEGFHFKIQGPGEYEIEDIRGKINVTLYKVPDIKPILQRIIKDKNVSAFSAARNVFPIEVRNAKEGDRIVPFGMEKSKKLKKVFIERKIPREMRRKLPVFVIGKKIAWIPGVIRSSHHPLGTRSKRVIVLEYNRY